MDTVEIIEMIDHVMEDSMNASETIAKIKTANPNLGMGVSTRMDLLIHFISFFIVNLGKLRKDFVRRLNHDIT